MHMIIGGHRHGLLQFKGAAHRASSHVLDVLVVIPYIACEGAQVRLANCRSAGGRKIHSGREIPGGMIEEHGGAMQST